jgi:ribosomal protein S18 acetylase RimI-like enzyme
MRRPGDDAGVAALDIDYETDVVFAAVQSGQGFELRPTTVSPPFEKRHPKGAALDEGAPWDTGWVAEDAGRIVGFAATERPGWNARLTLRHFYVDRGSRRLGIARRLMAAVAQHAREVAAKLIWLETANVNAPAVAAYRRMGFELCGLDLTLYAGTSAEGEFALFMSRPVGEAGA